jgi:hypothetical protein
MWKQRIEAKNQTGVKSFLEHGPFDTPSKRLPDPDVVPLYSVGLSYLSTTALSAKCCFTTPAERYHD